MKYFIIALALIYPITKLIAHTIREHKDNDTTIKAWKPTHRQRQDASWHLRNIR